jgi:hypothetical protein
MLIEFGTTWTLTQLDEFKVVNSLRTQNPKQRLNTVGTLSHAPTLKKMRTHRHLTQN